MKSDAVKKYRAWRKANANKKPNRAVVKMGWEDEREKGTESRVDTVALESVKCDNLPKDDGEILFYAGSLKGLLDLFRPGNGSDFLVLEVVEFYKEKL